LLKDIDGRKTPHCGRSTAQPVTSTISIKRPLNVDRVGVWTVQKRFDEAGAGAASVYGFPRGPIERAFVEQWLRKKEQAAARQQAAVLRWARIAGFTGMLAVILVVLLTPEGRDAVQRVATSLSERLRK
jgi:hypothetical protein